jgi:hypothetical protein
MRSFFALTVFLSLLGSSANAESWHFLGNEKKEGINREVPPGLTLERVVTLSSDRDKNVYFLNLMLDEARNVKGMYTEDAASNVKNPENEGEGIYFLDAIEGTKGAVLLKARGRDALIMKGLLDRSTNEGEFELKYLANGLTMRYESCNFNLKRAENGVYFAENAYTGERFDSIKVVTWALGITTVQGLCPSR